MEQRGRELSRMAVNVRRKKKNNNQKPTSIQYAALLCEHVFYSFVEPKTVEGSHGPHTKL